MMKYPLLLLLLLVAVAAQDFTEPNYQFNYGVHDGPSGQQFGQEEARRGENTLGQYQVQLPDGRTQTVTYSVATPGSGYVAAVHYAGEALYQSASAPGRRGVVQHLRPDRLSGRLVARPSLVKQPASQARPIQATLQARPSLVQQPASQARPIQARPSQVTLQARPSQATLQARPSQATSSSLLARDRRPTLQARPKTGQTSAKAVRPLDSAPNVARILDGGLSRPQAVSGPLVSRPASVRPTVVARPLVTRPRVARPQFARLRTSQLTTRPTPATSRLSTRPSAVKLSTRPSAVKLSTRPSAVKLSTRAQPAQVPSSPAELVTRPKSQESRRPKKLPMSAMKIAGSSTPPPPPPPTYIPKHASHAKDTYKEAFHASESRVLNSLFREDIKGQMKLPPKGGEEGEEEE